jgi:hypothetical protein
MIYATIIGADSATYHTDGHEEQNNISVYHFDGAVRRLNKSSLITALAAAGAHNHWHGIALRCLPITRFGFGGKHNATLPLSHHTL